jgi:hypothetical protein
MIALNIAWEVLGDPVSRAAYDRRRAAAAGPAARPGGPPAPSPMSPARPQAPSVGTVSADRTSGRSAEGSGYDPSRMRTPDGTGAAGPPPGNPSGSVLDFGRYAGWSLGEIGRRDVEYLEWLDRAPIGRAFRDEIDQLLRRLGRRRGIRPGEPGASTRGLPRR